MNESMEASVSAGGDLDAIISELDVPFHKLPEKAIQAARLYKDAIIPRLIGLIEDATRAVESGRQLETNGHFFALYLLGEFRARVALPAILKAISLPEKGPSELFGDAIHEGIPKVLAALAGDNDLDLVTSLIDTRALNEWVRWAAASSLVTMVAAGIRQRDEIMQLLRQHLRRAIDQQDSEIISGLVSTLCDLHPEEAYEEIKEAYAKNLVEEYVIQLSDVDYALQKGREKCLKRLDGTWALIEDTVAELKDWASFCRKEESAVAAAPSVPGERPKANYSFTPAVAPIRHPEERVGRNDPCPCGSGKKFKKCCGLRQ